MVQPFRRGLLGQAYYWGGGPGIFFPGAEKRSAAAAILRRCSQQDLGNASSCCRPRIRDM